MSRTAGTAAFCSPSAAASSAETAFVQAAVCPPYSSCAADSAAATPLRAASHSRCSRLRGRLRS
eukprot:4296682-Heterocapsa_arctica.AAC.1